MPRFESSPLQDEPPKAVLTYEGKDRFGYQSPTDSYQEDIDELKEGVQNFTYQHSNLSDLLQEVTEIGEAIEYSLAKLSQPAAPPHDPLTGEPYAELPARLKINSVGERQVRRAELSPEVLQDQLRQVRELTHQVEALKKDKLYDKKRSLHRPGMNNEVAQFLSTH